LSFRRVTLIFSAQPLPLQFSAVKYPYKSKADLHSFLRTLVRSEFYSSVMKAYIAISYSKKDSSADIINAVKEVLANHSVIPFLFVEAFTFTANEEKKMMQQAMKEIDNCDLLIAETTHKAIGIGVEAGYAKAKGKPVIYLRNKDAAHSTTVSGISDYQIVYSDTADLQKQLAICLKEFLDKL
jgi:2'-deoxynucleoside 5'-phosphate N-hydrolase